MVVAMAMLAWMDDTILDGPCYCYYNYFDWFG